MASSQNYIYSMTGFGKFQVEKNNLQVSIEVKSVNNRFKDVRFKMSSHLSSIEVDLRNIVNEKFKRGSFEIFINYKKIENASKFDEIDEVKVKAFLEKMKFLAVSSGYELSIKPTEFLRPEFMKEQDDNFSQNLSEIVMEIFPLALDSLKESRLIEGEKLVQVLKNHRSIFEENYKQVLEMSHTFKEQVNERLLKRFEEFQKNLSVDEPRFLQEVIYYLEKMDIHEELNRIAIHLKKFDMILESGAEVGRELDFLLQELNRETNTTGSKSTMQEISSLVVNMKVQLEKIREQALNLE